MLLSLKIKNSICCSIGLGANWIAFIHYCYWLNQAPFRYDKYFEGYIKIKDKKKLIKWHYPVRYLSDKSTISNGYKLGSIAYKKKMFKESKIGRSKMKIVSTVIKTLQIVIKRKIGIL